MRQMVLDFFPLLFAAIEGFVIVFLLLQLSAKTHIPSRHSQVSFVVAGLAGNFMVCEHPGPFFPHWKARIREEAGGQETWNLGWRPGQS